MYCVEHLFTGILEFTDSLEHIDLETCKVYELGAEFEYNPEYFYAIVDGELTMTETDSSRMETDNNLVEAIKEELRFN